MFVPYAPESIFVPNLTFTLQSSKFNHCSTVCEYNYNGDQGFLVAWYSGTRECADNQTVLLLYLNNKTQSTPLELGEKTGNPILWREGKKTYMLWSRFEDTGPLQSPTDRWKHCSLWVGEIELEYGQPPVLKLNNISKVISPSYHLLGRCRPLIRSGVTYLPLYNEMIGQNHIMSGSALNFKTTGIFGTHMIQATLWMEGNKIHSLSRNFHSPLRLSQSSNSSDGIVWSTPADSPIRNRNSSLHALNIGDMAVLIWNDTDTPKRVDLTIGVIDHDKITKVFRLSDYGSYPSICELDDESFTFSYTNAKGTITVSTWNTKEFFRVYRDLIRNGRTAVGDNSKNQETLT